jgi:hypothetical protein
MIAPVQIKAARVLTGRKQAGLVKAAGLSLTAPDRAERGEAEPESSALLRVERVLETAGIEFVPGGTRPPEPRAS